MLVDEYVIDYRSGLVPEALLGFTTTATAEAIDVSPGLLISWHVCAGDKYQGYLCCKQD